jgi:hypothetical protein
VAVTVHDFLTLGYNWIPPNDYERILSLTQVRDTVIILTEWRIWRAREDATGQLIVELVGHLQ